MDNEKLQQLPAVTSLASTDILYAVTNPATTPTDNKITFANLTSSIVPALTDSNTGQQAISRRDAWVFPDNNINGALDIQATKFYAVKALWYEINSSGAMVLRNNSSYGSNFYYTAANAALINANATESYVTLTTASIANVALMTASSTLRAAATSALVSFCQTNQFTGVELDCEVFSISQGATAVQYTNFKTWLNELGLACHAAGLKLMMDVPPIWDNGTSATPPEWNGRNSSAYYTLNYADLNNLPVDYICPLAFDYQDDLGAGYPNQPIAWMQAVATWIKSQINNVNRIIMGIPAAGYSGPTGGFSNTGHNYTFLSAQPGFSTATRDTSSAELIWANAGTSYAAMDDASMLAKIQGAEDFGITRVSLWYAGGNKYSNQRIQPLVPSERGAIVPFTPSLTFSTDYPASTKFSSAATNGTATYTAAGLTLSTSATATSYIRNLFVYTPDTGNNTIFHGNPRFTTNVTLNSVATLTGQWYAGMNNITVSGTGHTFTNAHVGFKMTTSGGITTLYATQADNTTENAVALTTVSQNDTLSLCVQVISGQQAIYWYQKNYGGWNGGTVLTANLPTDAIANTLTTYLQQSVSNVSTANAFITVSTGISVSY